jgi:hypothetical protein
VSPSTNRNLAVFGLTIACDTIAIHASSLILKHLILGVGISGCSWFATVKWSIQYVVCARVTSVSATDVYFTLSCALFIIPRLK